jgi:hypothetical protein
VAELVDALASGASGGNPVEVQVLSSVPLLYKFLLHTYTRRITQRIQHVQYHEFLRYVESAIRMLFLCEDNFDPLCCISDAHLTIEAISASSRYATRLLLARKASMDRL